MVSVMNRFMNFLGLQEEEEVVTRERVVEEEMDEYRAHEMRRNKGNVVSIHSQKNMKVVLTEPRAFEDTQEIADHLRSRRSVVVNLQRVRKEQAVKIVDFLSGTVYALNGSIVKVGPDIFLCAPDNVELQGTITEMLSDETD